MELRVNVTPHQQFWLAILFWGIFAVLLPVIHILHLLVSPEILREYSFLSWGCIFALQMAHLSFQTYYFCHDTKRRCLRRFSKRGFLILVFLIVIVGIFINAQEHAFIANMISILFVVGHSSLNLYYFAAENQEIIPEKSMLRA